MPPYGCGMFYKFVVNFLAVLDGFRMKARFSLSLPLSLSLSLSLCGMVIVAPSSTSS